MKRTKRHIALLLLIPLLLLTGCFEIIEDITLNPDGTGHFSFTVNLSQSRGKLATYMMLDSLNGKKIPKKEDILNRMNEIKVLAEHSPGIKDVKQKADFENFIFSFSCSFASIDTLNRFLNAAIKMQKGDHEITVKKHFSYDRKHQIFIRNAAYFEADDYSRLKEMEKGILEKSSIISVSRFQSNVDQIVNTSSILSPSGKAVMTKIKALDYLKGSATITNKITLTK